MAHDEFDDLAAALDPAMVVLTVAADDERAGCLVGFHAQASIDPPRYAVWISRANHTFGVARRATHLAVHLLGADDVDLARRFGTTTGDEVDKFAELAWTAGPDGVPLLDALPHRFVLRRTALFDDGVDDHVAFLGEPVDADGTGPAHPLRLAAVDDLTPGHPS